MRLLATLAAWSAVGILLSGCEEAPPAQAAASPKVTVATPLVRRIVDWDEHVGRFEAIERVEVRPRVSGYLVDVHFEDGERVDAGQPLFTIDPRPFEAELDAAKGRESAALARLENARTELERARGLADIRAVSQEELEELAAGERTSEAELAAARASVRAARLNLEFTRVLAPISGRVSYRRVDRGNAVRADETVLTTIVSVDPIHFVFQGSEALYLKYRRADAGLGRAVRIRLQDELDHRWTGVLDFMDNSVDARSGTIRGRAVIENPDGFLTPGLFGHMQLQASERYDAVLLPDSAIATRGADRIVYLVDDDGVVSARVVELGALHEGLRVIRSGLGAQDRVVVDGQQRARPGEQVDVLAARLEAPGADGAPVAIVPVDADERIAAGTR